MSKQRYIPINGQLHPVSEEVWQVHSRTIANERYRARRDHRCSNPRYQECHGDCGLCNWQVQGSILSLDKTVDTGRENSDRDQFGFEATNDHPLVEDVVCDRLLLEDLYRRLDQQMPEGSRIFQLLAAGHKEREIADLLGVRPTTLNYRKKKLFDYIRVHRDDFLD